MRQDRWISAVARRPLFVGRTGLALALCTAAACSSPPRRELAVGGPPIAAQPGPGAVTPTIAKGAGPAPSPAAPGESPPGVAFVGAAIEVPLDVTLEPVVGGGSLFAVSQHAGEGAGFARRYDGKSGAWGPVVDLGGRWFYEAFDLDADHHAIVTSSGTELCIARYANGAAVAGSRGCAEVAPVAVALAGGRFALIEATTSRAGARAAAPAKKAAKKAESTKKTETAKKKGPVKKKADAPRKKPSKAPLRDADRKKATARETTPRASRSARGTVEVSLRWASPEGVFDADAVTTGLRFEAPLESLGVIDALGDAAGVRLAWYETLASSKKAGHALRVTRSKKGSSFGRARITSGLVDPGGRFVEKSRTVMFEGDLGWGFVDAYRTPRFLAGSAGPRLLAVTTDRGDCTVASFDPPAAIDAAREACAVDPGGAGLTDDAMKGVLAEQPRRAEPQRSGDAGLVAWAGDRGLYLAGRSLRSIDRASGALRDEAWPLVARRSSIAWGQVAPDGEGIALVDDRLHRLHADGTLTATAPPGAGPDAVHGAEPGVAAPRDASRSREAPGLDHARAARIGDTFWAARGDVVRLPDGLRPNDLAGRAHPDTSALAGGDEQGLFLDLAGKSLRVTRVAADGATRPLARMPSPVRAGFDATSRARGGAIVAGVAQADPTRLVAVAIDASGRAQPVRSIALRVTPGELAVHLTPLPGGGALLEDARRERVVWLDDDANEVAAAAYPVAPSRVACPDGRPARAVVAAPAPGTFVPVPALAADACVVGAPVWTTDGSLRWFGSEVRGPDARAVVGIARLGAPAPRPAERGVDPETATQAMMAPGEAACLPGMVLVAGRYCVDRFESSLVDGVTGEALSPDHPATPKLLAFALGEGAMLRATTGDVLARAMPLPFLPAWQRGAATSPVATARLGVRPNGYVTGLVAESACAAAGKRLCTGDEFTTACRGEEDRQFPYGDDFVDGACNVFREAHPAAILHDNASLGHLDPRLNRVATKAGPLLRTTGGTPSCASRWGGDAIYDMVGNVDEWIDDPGGAFAGGFYARSTRSGCDALVATHPKSYLDYSTGVRCCKDAAP